MTDIMKLADTYADRFYLDRRYHNEESSYDRAASRAALQSAIETLQKDKVELGHMLLNLRDTANATIEALQAECAEHKENAIRNARQAVAFRAERDQLQYKLDELQRQEPFTHYRHYDEQVQPFADENTIPLYAAPKALEPLTDERKEAMAVYTAPFKYQHGYIFDSQQHMVADDDKVEEAVAARIRGWGKLSYLPNGAAIQDELGKTVADALTAYYAAHGITKGTP